MKLPEELVNVRHLAKGRHVFRFTWELKEECIKAMTYHFQYDFNFQAQIQYLLSLECIVSGRMTEGAAYATCDLKIGISMHVPENKPKSADVTLLEKVKVSVNIVQQVIRIGGNIYAEISVQNNLSKSIKVKVALKSEVWLNDGLFGHSISKTIKSVGVPLIEKGEDLEKYRLTIPTDGLDLWPSMVLNSGGAQRIIQSYKLSIKAQTEKRWKVPFSEDIDAKEFPIIISPSNKLSYTNK